LKISQWTNGESLLRRRDPTGIHDWAGVKPLGVYDFHCRESTGHLKYLQSAT
jgi:hypothetical protein